MNSYYNFQEMPFKNTTPDDLKSSGGKPRRKVACRTCRSSRSGCLRSNHMETCVRCRERHIRCITDAP
ncbi:hypothetical protein PNOK_0012500 [Pyrrhoderma noxium]|uniref:Zn(2)-C6 fungal-type domain-containing protein n=1 Tax=Pyrrhoderma noxium TaxID=2282107 RepID=A0A286UU07_9AGAM|nr:hypothetical protein PNOK_0012500 [Pyrrhoderma noxium]